MRITDQMELAVLWQPRNNLLCFKCSPGSLIRCKIILNFKNWWIRIKTTWLNNNILQCRRLVTIENIKICTDHLMLSNKWAISMSISINAVYSLLVGGRQWKLRIINPATGQLVVGFNYIINMYVFYLTNDRTKTAGG